MIKGAIRRHEEMEGHDNKIHEVIDVDAPREEKVLIIDCDSLIYTSSYSGKDEFTGVRNPDYTEKDYPEVEGLLWDSIMRVINDVEEYFHVTNTYICIKGNNNFRYKIYPQYKSNRPPSPPIVAHLLQWLKDNHDAIPGTDFESDDVCYTMLKMTGFQAVVATPDKDFNQCPAIFFDYNKNTWKRITEEDAVFNLCRQVLTGDSGDHIPGIVGIGPKKAENIIHRGMTTFGYLRAIYTAYKKYYGEDARRQLWINYNLVKLHDTNLPPPSLIQQLPSSVDIKQVA